MASRALSSLRFKSWMAWLISVDHITIRALVVGDPTALTAPGLEMDRELLAM